MHAGFGSGSCYRQEHQRMTKFCRAPLPVAGLIFLFMGCIARPAFSQVDLSGSWGPLYQEDFDERIPGPELVDWLGLPLNEAGRQWALSWDPSRLTLQEHQCQVHTAAYIFRGPM